jgi:hypothetical protein
MNPFRDRIVASPWDATGIDVPGIHGDVFARCVAAVETVREARKSAGLLIHGEAGSGKTHLLRQLRARLTPSAPADTSRRDSLFTWVRLQTSSRMIWRTLRRALVDDWFRPVAGVRSQFDRVLFHRLAEIRIAEGDLEYWHEYMLREKPADLAQHIDEIATALDLDRNTAVAFEHIVFGRHRRDLRAWLAGDSLPQAVLDQLGMVQEEGIDEEREEEARRVVFQLCLLAGEKLPVVIAFDQVEALQSNREDRDSLIAFGKVVGSLHDGPTNLVLLSSVQSSFVSVLKDVIREADAERMTSLGACSLDPVTREQALELIAARLAPLNEAATEERGRTWPLSEEEFERLFANNALTPRRLLTVCAERFDAPVAEPAIDIATTSADTAVSRGAGREAYLTELWERTFAERLRDNTPDRTELIVRHALPLVAGLFPLRAREARDENLKDIELIFEAPAGRAGLAFATHANMNSLTAWLKRIKQQWAEGRLTRLALLRDARVELTRTAKAARQHLEDLRAEGVVLVEPGPACLAGLDALRVVLSDAKSGDLADGGENVTPEEVADWLRGRLPADIRALLGEVLGAAVFGPEMD